MPKAELLGHYEFTEKDLKLIADNLKVKIKRLGAYKIVDYKSIAALCDYDKDTIFIDPDENPDVEEFIYSLVHELLHYCYSDLSEESVIKGEKIIANVLIRELNRLKALNNKNIIEAKKALTNK